MTTIAPEKYTSITPALLPAPNLMTRDFCHISASEVSPLNHQLVEDENRAMRAVGRMICCCQPCYSSTPSTPGPFNCERKGCNNTHGNWDVAAQRKTWEIQPEHTGFLGPDGLPGIGWSGFCSYNCAVQTYFNIKYSVCCTSEGTAIPTDDVECGGGCASCCMASCCIRQMYDPADDRLQKAGWDVEAGGGHCCCYTASPAWAQNTESLEPEGVQQLVKQIAVRNFTPEQVNKVNEFPENFGEQIFMKQVITTQVLNSEKLYDQAYTAHVQETAASFATVDGNSVKPLQNVSTIFELYEQARTTEETLKLFLTTEGADPTKMNGGHCATSVKGIRRAMTKIHMSYSENILALTDVCRGSLMFHDIDTLGNALQWMVDHPEVVQVLRIKNRFLEGKAAPGGYRDVLVNCRFPNDPLRHVFEVQLHLQAYHDLKKGGGGHKVYKIARFWDAVVNPVSTYNRNKAIEGAALNETDNAMFQRMQEFANGEICHSIYTMYESVAGSIRGQKDVGNVMACLLGLCIGGAIMKEIEANNMKNIRFEGMITDPPCPPVECRDTKKGRKDVLVRRNAIAVEGGLLSLCCLIHNVLKPLFEGNTNMKDCDLKAVLLESFKEDWSYTADILDSLNGDLASVLDGDASGTTTIDEMKGVNSLFCLSMVGQYKDTQKLQQRRSEREERIQQLNTYPVVDFIAGTIHASKNSSEDTKTEAFEFEKNKDNTATVTLVFDEVFDPFIKDTSIESWKKKYKNLPNRLGASICIGNKDSDGSSSEISKQKIHVTHVSPRTWCGHEYYNEDRKTFETETNRTAHEAIEACLVPLVIQLPTEPGQYEMTLVKDSSFSQRAPHCDIPYNYNFPTQAKWTKIISTKIQFVVT